MRVKANWEEVGLLIVVALGLVTFPMVASTVLLKPVEGGADIVEMFHVSGQQFATIGIALFNNAGRPLNVTRINAVLTYRYHPSPTAVAIPGDAGVTVSSPLPVELRPGERKSIFVTLPVANDEISRVNITVTLADASGGEMTKNFVWSPSVEKSVFIALAPILLVTVAVFTLIAFAGHYEDEATATLIWLATFFWVSILLFAILP